jgi:hypothetical protein
MPAGAAPGGVGPPAAGDVEAVRADMLELAALMDSLGLLVGGRRRGGRGRRAPGPGSRPPVDLEAVGVLAECEAWVDHVRWDLSVDRRSRAAFRVRCPHPLVTSYGAHRLPAHIDPATGALFAGCMLAQPNMLRMIAREWAGLYASDPELLILEYEDLGPLLRAARGVVDGGDSRRLWLPADMRCPVLEPCGRRLYAVVDEADGQPAEIRCASGDDSHRRPPQEWPLLEAVLRQTSEEAAARAGAAG